MDALGRLTREEQYRVWDAVQKFHANPRLPGLQVKKMWKNDCYEIRASQELRIIGRLDGGDLCCYHVGHHDEALKAAERGVANGRDLSRVKSLASTTIPSTSDVEADRSGASRAGPLAHLADADLSERFSVPPDWIGALRSLRTQEQFLAQNFEDVIPENAWFELTEMFPTTPKVSTGALPTFRVASDRIAKLFSDGEIRDLQYNLPASSWALIERENASPVLVRGGPGSGKTLVAIYRAIHVLGADQGLGLRQAPRVLYVTFTNSLVEESRNKFERLLGKIPENLKLATVDSLAHAIAPKGATMYDSQERRAFALRVAQTTPGAATLDLKFFLDEVDLVIGDRTLRTLDQYLALERKGRGERLGVSERRTVWLLYERYCAELALAGKRDRSMLMRQALDAAAKLDEAHRYDMIVIDELQDLAPAQIAFLLAFAKGEGRTKHVMMVGDAGQSIYRTGFKWSDVGLRIGGGNVVKLARSERNTVEILNFANAIVGPEFEAESNESGDLPERHGTPPNLLVDFRNRQAQAGWLAEDIVKRTAAGVAWERIAVISRTVETLKMCAASLRRHAIPTVTHGEAAFYKTSAVKLITTHSSKGLEFAIVYVVGADDDLYPLPYPGVPEDERVDREAQDCKLLYVACTRACDELTVLAGPQPSRFLARVDALAERTTVASRYADSRVKLL